MTTDELLSQLNAHIAAMPLHQKERRAGRLLISARDRIRGLTAPLPDDLEAELQPAVESILIMFGHDQNSPRYLRIADAIRPLLQRAAGVRADDWDHAIGVGEEEV